MWECGVGKELEIILQRACVPISSKCATFKNRNAEIALESMPIEEKESLLGKMILKHQAQPSWWRNYSFPCIYGVQSLLKNPQVLSHPRRWKRPPRLSVQFCSLKCTWFMQQFSLVTHPGLLHSQTRRTRGFWYGYGTAALTVVEDQYLKAASGCLQPEAVCLETPNAIFLNCF